jgi:hypothetical protein
MKPNGKCKRLAGAVIELLVNSKRTFFNQGNVIGIDLIPPHSSAPRLQRALEKRIRLVSFNLRFAAKYFLHTGEFTIMYHRYDADCQYNI